MTNAALDLLKDSFTVNHTTAAQYPLLEIRTLEHQFLASGWFVRLYFLALGLMVNGRFLEPKNAARFVHANQFIIFIL